MRCPYCNADVSRGGACPNPICPQQRTTITITTEEDPMQCSHCGGPVIQDGNVLVCQQCHSRIYLYPEE